MTRVERPLPREHETMAGRFATGLRGHAATVGFLLLLVAFIGLVLLPGYRLASQLAADTAALKLASEQRGQPAAIARSLVAIRDRLGSGVYVAQAIRDLGMSIREFDRGLAQLQQSAAADSAELRNIDNVWSAYRKAVVPVSGFKGLPYRDSDSAGVQLNAPGQQLLQDARHAIKVGHDATEGLNSALASVSSSLEQQVVTASATLRTLMITGVVFAGLLLTLLAYFQWLKTRHERIAVEARNQTRDILSTVKDGLFLIDADFRIGKAHSTALSTLFRRDDFSHLTLEDLLRDTVSEKTLATATKYVRLLWGERANENLIRSINPLAEVEVHFERADGGRDLRYLQFDFHRVKGEEGVRHLLVSVNDVTSRVLLARELKDSQANAQGQMDTMLGLLQVDPQQLSSFLDETGATLAQVNNVLKVPARGDADYRAKVDPLFRAMHRIKGEAAMLGLASIEGRAHSFEELLKDVRERPQLSGNDFLPLVLRLDEILSHLQSIRELVGRVDALRAAALLTTAPPTTGPRATVTAIKLGKRDLGAALDALAQRIATDQGKKVRLEATGLDDVPGEMRRTVCDIAIQLVRNAVVHGIEDATSRRELAKDETGLLQIQFKSREGGFELSLQDDGHGIVAERMREAAVRRGDLSEQEARQFDTRSSLALIFKPGFSTHEGDSRDAGRGVGLDFVNKAVQAMGGRIGVSTAPGKYTRFSILLPAASRQNCTVA